MIERQITLGLITSTDFLRQLQRIWDPALLESSTARLVASWCWEYFDQYQRAPVKDFEGIYYQKLRDGHLQKDLAKELEEEILPGLSKEFEASPPNIDYLLTQTKQYLRERHLLLFADNLKAVIERGQGDESQRVTQAEQLAGEYRPLMTESEDGLDLSNEAKTIGGAGLDWALGRIGGQGAYHDNSLIKSSSIGVPAFSGSGQSEDGLMITHEEYMGDIYVNQVNSLTAPFQGVASVVLNPALASSFPWLGIKLE